MDDSECFFQSTSLHGVRDLYLAHKKSDKIALVFWFFVVVMMALFVGLGSFWIIQGYIDAPTVTTVTAVAADDLLLPDIAICYMGRPNVTKMEEAGAISTTFTLCTIRVLQG